MTDIRNLPQLIAANQFIPANRQIRARNVFYQALAGTVLPDQELATVLLFGAPAAVSKWWDTPGFVDWWTSPDWEKEESQRLLLQAMNRVGEILRDAEDNDTIIKAAKEAREIYTKLNTVTVQKFADDDIGKMDRQQLAEYIRRNTASIQSIPNTTVPSQKAIDK